MLLNRLIWSANYDNRFETAKVIVNGQNVTSGSRFIGGTSVSVSASTCNGKNVSVLANGTALTLKDNTASFVINQKTVVSFLFTVVSQFTVKLTVTGLEEKTDSYTVTANDEEVTVGNTTYDAGTYFTINATTTSSQKTIKYTSPNLTKDAVTTVKDSFVLDNDATINIVFTNKTTPTN